MHGYKSHRPYRLSVQGYLTLRCGVLGARGAEPSCKEQY